MAQKRIVVCQSAVLRRGGPRRAHRARLWERGIATLKALIERTGGIAMHRAALAMRAWDTWTKVAGTCGPSPRRSSRPCRASPHWFPGMVMLADAATWLRDADAAARIRAPLEPVSGRTAWNAFTALWPVDIAVAQLSVLLGEHARAHEYLDAAERTCERNDLPAHSPTWRLARLR